MAMPFEKLAESLEVLKELQEKGITAIKSTTLSRTHRVRLLNNGFLKEVTKGWYIATPFVPLTDIAKDLRTVTVYFHPIGAQRFIDFLTNAFGATELMRHAENDMIMHAKVQVGDSVIELGEARTPDQPLPTAIYLYVEDVDAMYERAVNAGGVSMQPPTNQEYGDRNAWVKDPFDNVWYIAAPVTPA